MTNYFGDGQSSKGENHIWRKAKRERWKIVAKYKSIKRVNNQRLKKYHIEYRLDISNISNETWKNKWKQKILQRYRLLHPPKEVETFYKGFISLQPKVDLKQFDETINLGDTPIEFMNQSIALRETLNTNLHCTGSKDDYGSASNYQLSRKNLDCQPNSGFNTEENFVNKIKDVKSNIDSINFDQPKIYSDRSDDTSS
jgi:hypothetical protein